MTLPPVVPLPKPKPSKKKRTFAELLSSGRHADKENLSDSPAGNSADTTTGNTAGAGNVVQTAAVLSSVGNTSALNTDTQASKPPKLSQKGRCGQCKTCLKPKSKKACLVRAAERAAVKQATTVDLGVSSTAV